MASAKLSWGPPLSDVNLDVSKNGVLESSGLDFGSLGPRFWSLRASILKVSGLTCRKKSRNFGLSNLNARKCKLGTWRCLVLGALDLNLEDSRLRLYAAKSHLANVPYRRGAVVPRSGGGGGPPTGVSIRLECSCRYPSTMACSWHCSLAALAEVLDYFSRIERFKTLGTINAAVRLPSGPWNDVLVGQMASSWHWNGALDGLKAPSWLWNDILGGQATPSWP